MGTSLEVLIICSSSAIAHRIFHEIYTTCQQWEHIFSRFITTSLISELNSKKKIIANDIFLEVLQKAQEGYKMTNGTFNPFYSPFFFGYENDFEKNNFTLPQKSSFGNFEDITISKDSLVCIPPQGYLDFGGIVKGYLAQKLVKKYAHRVYEIIVNIGGDLTIKGTDTIHIYNPVTKKSIPIHIQNCSISTSGTYKRKWDNHHHIIDPNIFSSSKSDIISASIIHPKGYIAEVLATASIIWGKEKAKIFLNKNKISYIFIGHDGLEEMNVHPLLEEK